MGKPANQETIAMLQILAAGTLWGLVGPLVKLMELNGSTAASTSFIRMTMAFLTLSMTEMFHSFNVRSIEHSVFSMKKQNKYLWGAFVFSFLLTLAVIYLPGINTAFEFAAISAKEYFIAIGLALTVIPFVEICKLVRRAVKKNKAK